ncbi:MAG TPA: adenylate/guanylate cyclase domain-containing protein [Candidatus Ozemobacteraceae bacterium]
MSQPPNGNGISAALARFLEVRSGLLFALISVAVAFLLLGSHALNGVEEYLHAFYLQAGYESPVTRSDLMIIKKDEVSSELIGRNPARGDFASIIRLLTRRHFIQTISSTTPAFYGGVELRIGMFEVKGSPVVNSLSEWERAILTAQAKQRGEKAPGRASLGSFVTFTERFWTPKGTSVLSIFDPPGAVPTGADPEQEMKLFDQWGAFFLNILRGYCTITIRIDPDKETKFVIGALFCRPAFSAGRWVEPATVVGWDFLLQGKKEAERHEDIDLREAILTSSSPIVLAAQVSETMVTEQKMAEEGPEIGRMQTSTAKRIAMVMPEEEFQVATTDIGFINIGVAEKGNVTKIPLFVELPDHRGLKPAFCLAVAAHALDRRQGAGSTGYRKAVDQELERITPLWKQGTYAGGFQLKDIAIPCDDKGFLTIDFTGSYQRIGDQPPRMAAVSFYECFDAEHLRICASETKNASAAARLDPAKAHFNTLLRSDFGGRVCLVGPSEASDFDFYSTPLTVKTPFNKLKEQLRGIEIHANAVQNILDKKFLRPADTRVTLLLLVLTTLLLGYLLDLCSPVAGAVLMLSGMAGVFILAYHSYHTWGQLIGVSPCLVSYPLTWAATVLTNYFRQRAKANTTKAMFSRFVSRDVVQFMLEHPEMVKPGGQKVEMTIFFSDVAGFTSISEALTPEELVVLLNEYLGTMTDILFKYGGTLDKFIGDAVMAFWNFPKGQPDHATRACLCALEMQATINELQKGWAKRGLPRVAARCGMNTAHVVVGYMGSIKAQMNFTCMGDGVNLASRLEGANKEYGTMMMISDATYQQAKDRVSVRFLDFLAVKGKKEPVKVYELAFEKGKESPDWFERVALYDEGIRLHLERRWDEAIAKFEELLVRWPDDGPSKTYIARCNEYKVNPPPDDWDGSYHLTHK